MNNNALVKKNQTRTSWWNLITESMRQLPHSRTNNWSTKPDISRVPYSDFWAQCFKKQVSGNKLPMLNKKSLTWKIGDIWWPILPACKRAAEQASLQISPFCFRINAGQSEIKHRGYSSTSGPPSLQHTHTVKTIPCYGPEYYAMSQQERRQANAVHSSTMHIYLPHGWIYDGTERNFSKLQFSNGITPFCGSTAATTTVAFWKSRYLSQNRP